MNLPASTVQPAAAIAPAAPAAPIAPIAPIALIAPIAPIAPIARIEKMLARLRDAPWAFGFIASMRHFGAAMAQGQPRIGLARRPVQEPFRLGQAASLAFAPREIADAVLPDPGATRAPGAAAPRSGNNASLPVIRLFGLGMLGPHGPLPLHVTEWVRDRVENHGDSTLADFLDLFHHRFLTHMYRAWAQGQAAAGLDRPGDETFSGYVARLTGHDPAEIRESALPSHARLSASMHLASESRNPDGLCATLAQFFAVPVRLDEFVLHWIRIDDDDRTHLGRATASSVMGMGAIAGEVVADRQSKFRLVLGPLSLPQYLRFTPQGRDLPLLVEWVRGFVGFEFIWDVELRVRRDHAPPARLGADPQLGWSTWLGAAASGPADFTVGMVFEPEQYVGEQAALRKDVVQ